MCSEPFTTNQIAGFTLIELSIVLVIIGLLVGGILTGRDLIRAAEIRATIGQEDKFNTAVNTFKAKFNCLPGDCINALEFGLGTAGGPGDNGNGDGIIGSGPSDNCDNNVNFEEMVNFWYHLTQAQLINDQIALPPANPCNSLVAVQSPGLKFSAANGLGNKGGWWIVSEFVQIKAGATPDQMKLLPQGHYFWITGKVDADDYGAAVLLPSDAYAIDAKIDDGLPFTGTVHAATDYSLDSYGATETIGLSAGPRGGPTCIANDVTPNQYNLTATSTGSGCGTQGGQLLFM